MTKQRRPREPPLKPPPQTRQRGKQTPEGRQRAGTRGEPFKIAFFTDAQDNSYLQAAIAAAQEHADERGVDMEVIDATWDANKQLGQVQDAVSSGQYDALVVESVDGEVLCE